uniref:Zinc finger BED domain-containing protein RICESLEEPER 2-like n=1 Tax=Tanacetum cinerariifolium TaxID=118510 RepID=A0A699H528_TANCI|nr:hypothetical protein [Tanacetum cinerariifolium]
MILPEHPSDAYVFTMKMEILLESTSNKLMVGIRRALLMLEILSRWFFLKLNLSDHRKHQKGVEIPVSAEPQFITTCSYPTIKTFVTLMYSNRKVCFKKAMLFFDRRSPGNVLLKINVIIYPPGRLRDIAFEDFSVLHMGSALARMLRTTFFNFNLEAKIMSITLDNASNNTNAIGKLKLEYDPPMEDRFYHSRCVAHIINLVVPEELLIETTSMDLEFFDDGHATKAKKWFNDSLEGLYNIYYAEYGNPTTESRSEASSSRVSGGNQMTNLFGKLLAAVCRVLKDNSLLPTTQTESTRKKNVITAEKISVLTRDFWCIIPTTWGKGCKKQFLMIKEDHLDAQECKQHTSTLENALDFEDEILDAEVQENEATPLSGEEIALDAASQGTIAFSSGGEEQDFDFDLTNYGIDD